MIGESLSPFGGVAAWKACRQPRWTYEERSANIDFYHAYRPPELRTPLTFSLAAVGCFMALVMAASCPAINADLI